MTKQKIKELKEKLADIEHQRWADWQRYLHSKLKYSEHKDGDRTIACYIMDAGDYEHWERQIDTNYKDLTEKEKDSDREQVERYFPLFIKALKQQKEEIVEMINEMNNFRSSKSDNEGYEQWNRDLEQTACKIDALVKQINNHD